MLPPADLVAELDVARRGAALCGDGALRFATEFDELEHVELAGPAFDAPSAVALVELATAASAPEEFVSADDVLPLYLRQSDAEISWDRRS